MRLPRWLVIAMLSTSVLAVLAAAVWWWITWPERTARAFAELMRTRKYQEARESFGWVPRWTFDGNDISGRQETWSQSNVHPQERTLSEVIAGTQNFKVGSGGFEFTVERGIIHGENAELLY